MGDAELIEFIRHKRDWEGFPDFIEWVDPYEAEDSELKDILEGIMSAHIKAGEYANLLDDYLEEHSVNDSE